MRVFLTTHELNEAERLSDRLVIMHQGRVLAQGTLDELSGDAGDDHPIDRGRRSLVAGPLAAM